MRTFTLNSREFYEGVTPAPQPHVWAGGLPREPLWPGPGEGVWVLANIEPRSSVRGTEREAEDAAGTALREWLGCVEAGRIG
jgi:hypothetical protein